jgi:NADH dehydrogenase FAD-containing subunit
VRQAIADVPHAVSIVGTIGWFTKLGVRRLVFLTRFRNRLVVLTNWTWSYLTWAGRRW